MIEFKNYPPREREDVVLSVAATAKLKEAVGWNDARAMKAFGQATGYVLAAAVENREQLLHVETNVVEYGRNELGYLQSYFIESLHEAAEQHFASQESPTVMEFAK